MWWKTWHVFYCKFLAESNGERILKSKPKPWLHFDLFAVPPSRFIFVALGGKKFSIGGKSVAYSSHVKRGYLTRVCDLEILHFPSSVDCYCRLREVENRSAVLGALQHLRLRGHRLNGLHRHNQDLLLMHSTSCQSRVGSGENTFFKLYNNQWAPKQSRDILRQLCYDSVEAIGWGAVYKLYKLFLFYCFWVIGPPQLFEYVRLYKRPCLI